MMFFVAGRLNALVILRSLEGTYSGGGGKNQLFFGGATSD
jgi:hypothetical protein